MPQILEPADAVAVGDQGDDGDPAAGFSINPNAADGKTSCSDDGGELRHRGRGPLPGVLEGRDARRSTARRCRRDPRAIYLGEPQPGDRYRLFLTADGFATHIKLAGTVHPDPQTGRLTVAFDDLPQSPFTEFNMHFFGSERGLLATPTQCGTYAVESDFTPGTRPAEPELDPVLRARLRARRRRPARARRARSPRASAPARPATPPARTARSRSNWPRRDGDQNLTASTSRPPPGFSATLNGIPYCPEARDRAAAEAPAYAGLAEQASPSCPAASQVGTAMAGAGAGQPPALPAGKVYLAGPYKGAPLSLVVS